MRISVNIPNSIIKDIIYEALTEYGVKNEIQKQIVDYIINEMENELR